MKTSTLTRTVTIRVGVATAIAVALLSRGALAAGPDEPLTDYGRIRDGLRRPVAAAPVRLLASAPHLSSASPPRTSPRAPRASRGSPRSPGAQAPPAAPHRQRDSLWNGVLIGAAVGGGGGLIWAGAICSDNDAECGAIAVPIGLFVGAGIGAGIGALVDALR